MALTVLFMPESAYGPTNNCIGIGRVLLRAGHRVVFAAEASWKGRLEPLGFEEALVDLAPPAAEGAEPGQFWKEFIAATAPEFRKTTIEQLETFMAPTWQALVDGARYCEPQLKAILDEVRPDVVVEDNVVCFPALLTQPAAFARIISCNPLEVRSPHLPPPYSGLPAQDPSGWAEFRDEYDRTHRPMWSEFAAWVTEQGAPPLPDLEFMPRRADAQLYVYPEQIDYPRERGFDRTWVRLESSVRDTDAAYEFPPHLQDRPPGSALVYLSLGSLGSADVSLMQRLIGLLADTPHRYLVSTGPRQTEYQLAPNMAGEEFLPQTTVLPLVDLVITHAGNNTVTESLHFGKPMVALPLFWDQHDNAQRLQETGIGVRLDPYTVSAAELRGAIDRLLADRELAARLAAAAQRIRESDGVRRAAATIEAAARRLAAGS